MQRDEFQSRLDRASRGFAKTLDDAATRRARQRALERVWLLAPIPALIVLFVFAGSRLFDFDMPAIPAAVLVFGTLALVVFVAMTTWFSAGTSRGVSKRDALARADRELGLDERLLSASQFLESEESSPFAAAAIEDAEPELERLERHQLKLFREPARFGTAASVALLAAIPLLILAVAILPDASAENPFEGATPRSSSRAELEAPRKGLEGNERRDEPQSEDIESPKPRRPDDAQRAEARTAKLPLSDQIKDAKGASGEGKSADAADSSGASNSRGAPSNQAQSSKTSKKPSKKKPKKKKKGSKKDEAAPKQKDAKEDAGATAGRGAASGSNKSPASSTWSSKDQVVSDDEDDLEDDEEIDDEFEENEARGGIQPSLRDRRPPVNRDLSISFGNGKDPDANGRGGPSEQKKSRGVASLVLGVPIPDHIKGRPNSGKTKITQERVEPKEERAQPLAAEDRQPREAPIGTISRPELEPWMRRLLRDYYLTIRSQEARP